MSKRFDEMELYPGTAPLPPLPVPAGASPPHTIELHNSRSAPRLHRLLAILTDLSLFAAMGLALTPLMPTYADLGVMLEREAAALSGIAGFLVLISFFYFVGMWLIWGRTIGGTIFNVRIASEDGTAPDFRSLVMRWATLYLSLLTCGAGFLLALLPGARSLSDRISRTRAESA